MHSSPKKQRVIVTPAVYLSLNEFHRVDIQSTEQKSQYIYIQIELSYCYGSINQLDSLRLYQFKI